MKRKKPISNNSKLDWRNTNMPVIRYGKIDGKLGNHLIPEKWITEYSNHQMRTSQEPNFRNDPSYWWNRKK